MAPQITTQKGNMIDPGFLNFAADFHTDQWTVAGGSLPIGPVGNGHAVPSPETSLDQKIHALDDGFVFQDLPYVWLACDGETTNPRAAELFEELRSAKAFRRGWVDAKRRAFAELFASAESAAWNGGCIVYPRNRARGITQCQLRVIDAAIEIRLFRDVPGKAGGKHRSRLIPLSKMRAHLLSDPAQFDSAPDGRIVRLRDRQTKAELAFDPDHPVASEFSSKLELINEVNSRAQITCENDPDTIYEHARRILRPRHFARFTDDFEFHGRIYTGRYGHQSLSKELRETIRFNGEPSVELDFRGMHPRLIYHLYLKEEYQDDPYVWWPVTSESMRKLAKKLLNSAINAKERGKAISACNYACCFMTDKGEHRQGNKLKEARKLMAARKKCGLTFKEIYPLMLEHHRRIAQYLGNDLGIRLMRVDGQIALNVMYEFACRNIPILGCHDSFVVPRSHESTLRTAMTDAYRNATGGFNPLID